MTNSKIYLSIKRQLIKFEITPGSPIVIPSICEEMSVSHIPVREALACLALEGWVLHIPNRGYFARTVDIDSVLESYFCLELVLEHCLDSQLLTYKELSLETFKHDPNFIDRSPLWTFLNRTLNAVENRYLLQAGKNALEHMHFIAIGLWNAPASRQNILRHIRACTKHLQLNDEASAIKVLNLAFSERRKNIMEDIKYSTKFATESII